MSLNASVGPLEQFEDMHARHQRTQRRDLAEIRIVATVLYTRRCRFTDDGFQILRRNIGGEPGQHFKRQIGIRQIAPGIQFGATH